MSGFGIVVRSFGERTAGLVVDAWNQESSVTPFVTSNIPFRQALAESFEFAIESNFEWLITCDADVIPLCGAFDLITKSAMEMPSDVGQVAFTIHDHIFGWRRNGGVRLYRVRNLPLVLTLLNQGDAIRPESSTLKLLSKEGHPSVLSATLVGVHDKHQFYRDVFRTCVLHASKHREHLVHFVNRYTALLPEPEAIMVLGGLTHGLLNPAESADYRESVVPKSRELMAEHGIPERTLIEGAAFHTIRDDLGNSSYSRHWRFDSGVERTLMLRDLARNPASTLVGLSGLLSKRIGERLVARASKERNS